MEKEKGFTLLELLMVVIIIAILASLALPQYIRATEKARASEALQLLGSLRSSQQRYRAFSPTNAFATAINDLDAEMPTATKFWGAAAITATNGVFTRNSGAFSGCTVGINWNSGNVCGTFSPVVGNAAIACP
jgi:prepilin-type N-terminal cleavage/methylation domain-containing protein